MDEMGYMWMVGDFMNVLGIPEDLSDKVEMPSEDEISLLEIVQ